MILVLSDGGKNLVEIEKQLKLHNDKYVCMFSDFIVASRFGKGNVLIGKPSKREFEKVYRENKIDAVIDATEKPVSKLSQAALSAISENIKYIKLAPCREYEGAEICLSYKTLADKIKNHKDNTLIYGASGATRTIAEYAEERADKIFVTVKKSPVFNVNKALEFGIPIFNVKESDELTVTDEIKKAVEKLSVGQVIFTENSLTDELIDSAKEMGASVYITHSAGIEYPYCVNNMRDALILIHSKEVI